MQKKKKKLQMGESENNCNNIGVKTVLKIVLLQKGSKYLKTEKQKFNRKKTNIIEVIAPSKKSTTKEEQGCRKSSKEVTSSSLYNVCRQTT